MKIPEYQIKAALVNHIRFTPFLMGYVEAIFFTESGESTDELNEKTLDDFSISALVKIVSDCALFKIYAGTLPIRAWGEDQAGHDFWLTRNRHGAGFWDRGNGERGEFLTEVSHLFKEVHYFVDPGTGEIYGE